MNERTRTGLEILEAAVLLGILGDALLRATPWGLNIFLWVGALASALVFLFLRRKSEHLNFHTMALTGALMFFAAMFLVRDSIQLRVFDTMAILAILALLALPAMKIKAQVGGAIHYMVAGAASAVGAFVMPFLLVFDDVDWNKMSRGGWTKHIASVLRGLAIAVPIIFVFGALFMAADSVFEGLVQRVFRFDPEYWMPHIFVTAFLTWTTAGYLRGSVFGFNFAAPTNNEESKTGPLSITPDEAAKTSAEVARAEHKPAPMSITEDVPSDTVKEQTKTEPEPAPKPKWSWQNFDNSVMPEFATLGKVEISIVLGLINLLFLTFVIIQIPYLFGGMDLVQTTPDFKLADYARRGFFELVWVALLVLPILLTSHWLMRRDKPVNELLFRILAGIQIGLLFVIMISAAQRMLLYTGNLGYGLTLQRFYPMAFMSWLALVFIWFAATVLRGAREKFAWGALWLGFFVLGTLHVMNPDDFVVRTNVKLWQQGRQFDSLYTADLSDDATPALLEALPGLNFTDQCRVKGKLLKRLAKTEDEADLRMWNWSRSHAKGLMNNSSEIFDINSCPANSLYRQYRYDD